MRSEAGFYIRGARLTVFNVQKMAFLAGDLGFGLRGFRVEGMWALGFRGFGV